VIEILIFAAVSTLLYRLGMGPFLFLIPLQVLYVRQGKRSFVAGSALALLLILLVGVLLARRWDVPGTAQFLLLDMAVAALLLGGLMLIQLPEMSPELYLPRLRRPARLAIATGIAGLLCAPLILYLGGNEAFTSGVREFFGDRIVAMNRTLNTTDLPATVAPIQTEPLLQALQGILLRSFLFYYFLLLTGSWWLGTVIGARSMGRKPGLTRIVDFKLPDTFIWPLIASLALVLLNLLVPVKLAAVLGWNGLLILLFLYGLSGLGIIRFLLKKTKIRPGMRWMLIAVIIILIMTPKIGFAVLILIPGLGVSEIWLKYRRPERSNV
jgi:hypothetical protein